MSSGGIDTQGLEFDSIEMHEDSLKAAVAFSKAKRGPVELVHLTQTWSREIVMRSMHPSWLGTDGVDRGLPGFSTIMGPLLRAADQGADTMVWLATGGADAARPGGFWQWLLPQTDQSDSRSSTTTAWSWQTSLDC